MQLRLYPCATRELALPGLIRAYLATRGRDAACESYLEGLRLFSAAEKAWLSLPAWKGKPGSLHDSSFGNWDLPTPESEFLGVVEDRPWVGDQQQNWLLDPQGWSESGPGHAVPVLNWLEPGPELRYADDRLQQLSGLQMRELRAAWHPLPQNARQEWSGWRWHPHPLGCVAAALGDGKVYFVMWNAADLGKLPLQALRELAEVSTPTGKVEETVVAQGPPGQIVARNWQVLPYGQITACFLGELSLRDGNGRHFEYSKLPPEPLLLQGGPQRWTAELRNTVPSGYADLHETYGCKLDLQDGRFELTYTFEYIH